MTVLDLCSNVTKAAGLNPQADGQHTIMWAVVFIWRTKLELIFSHAHGYVTAPNGIQRNQQYNRMMF